MPKTMGDQEAAARIAALEHASRFSVQSHVTPEHVLNIAGKYLDFLMGETDKT